MKTSALTRIALLLALLIISAQFAIPFGPVAISLQTLIVLIIGLILPTYHAVLTTTLYLIVGLIGLPVFTQAMGGPYSVLLPSFGFILSFIPAVWVISKITTKNSGGKRNNYIIAVVVGTLVIYLIGISYMSGILVFYLGNEMTLWKILSIGMLPFIPGDIIKAGVAITISKRLNTYLSSRPS